METRTEDYVGINDGGVISLDEFGAVTENDRVVLFDTSVLISPLTRRFPNNHPVERRDFESQVYMDFLDEFYQNENWVITSGVNEEFLEPFPYCHKAAAKRIEYTRRKGRLSRRQAKRALATSRATKRVVTASKSFANFFSENQRFLLLDEIEDELVDLVCRKYSHLQERFGLSEVDWDLLASGIACTYTRGNVSLVSNDIRGILGALRSFLNQEYPYDSSKIRFFTREGFTEFERKI